ncbi:MAG TPA: hypothetical protein VN428_26100 [Bryobacteraceae bacterium]|nr:hypothetical protein [Bryobacteraceae bacterium]
METRRTRPVVVVAAFALIAVTAVIAAIAADFAYTMFVAGAWTPDYWLDRAHIPRSTSAPDPELGFVRKPNLSWKGEMNGKRIAYRNDENGFRNPPGVTQADIAFIGDSFTEAAHMLEELTFVQRVASGAGLRTVNLGRGAYGPQQELIVLKRYALRYHPKVIVWQFFTGNDVNDAEEFAHWVLLGRKSDTPLLTRYLNNSFLRRTLKDVLHLPTRGTVPATLRYTDGSSEEVRVLYEREPPVLQSAAHEIEHALAEGARICNERGIKLIVFTVPTMLHILQPYIHFREDEARKVFVGGRDAARRSEFTEWLNHTCNAIHGCKFIDVWSRLHAAAQQDNRALYIPNDEHLDERGHEVVAKAILEVIGSQHRLAASSATLP